MTSELFLSLIVLILLICFSYSFSTFAGKTIKSKGIAKYVTRPTEAGRTYRRHSSFSIGLHGHNWLDSIVFFQDVIPELLSFFPHKQSYYRKGMRAAFLRQQAL